MPGAYSGRVTLMPLPALITLAVGLSVLATTALVLLARVTHRRHKMTGTEDVETAYITVIGTLYAIFLAFMVFVVWSRFFDAAEAVDQEANALANLYRLSAALPQPYRTELQGASIDYAHLMISREWPAMAAGESSSPSRPLIRRMWRIISGMKPSAVPDFVLRDHVTTQFVRLTDLRRTRLLHARVSLPGILYGALFFGAAVTLAVATLFTARDLWPHVFKAAAVAALLAFLLLTIHSLDHPFQGQVHVPSDAFGRALQAVQRDGF